MATGTGEFLYHYKAKITSVYDGDGIYESRVRLGIGVSCKKQLRLHGVDCPEMKGNHRLAGIVVRDFVRNLILGKTIIIKTHKDHLGKYGRLLVDIFIDDVSLARTLISKGYAKEYFGGTKTPWTFEELQYIVNNPTDNSPITTLYQFCNTARASSEYSSSRYGAHWVQGPPDTGLKVNDTQQEHPKAWAQAKEDKGKLNNIICNYVKKVYIKSVDMLIIYNPDCVVAMSVYDGTVWKVVFNVQSSSNQGGTISGVQQNKVSLVTLTLDTPLAYPSNKIQLYIGGKGDKYHEIDSIRLIGTDKPETQSS
jgi:micrococcal nuclease